MKFHEAANLFPLLEGEAFEQFVADIKEHGQHEPIVCCDNQTILDGRNRYNACQRLGIPPRYAYHYDIADPVSYVISLNIHRRHLTIAQRAAIVAEAAPLYRQQAKEAQLATLKQNQTVRSPQLGGTDGPTPGTRGDWAERAAAAAGVGKGTVIRAEQIKRCAPDLHEKVKAGQMSGLAAYEETKRRREETPAGQAKRKREEDELTARRQQRAAERLRPVRDERTDAVVEVFAAIREIVLASDPYLMAQGMDKREDARVRAAARDLDEWVSKWDVARADLRRQEQLQAAAAVTAGPA